MEISRTRTIKINLGNYEHWEEFFRVTGSTEDTNDAVQDLEAFIDEKLDELTLAFIQKASNITACQESASLDPAFAKTFTPATTTTKTRRT